MRALTIRVAPDVRRRLSAAAERDGVGLAAFVRRALADYLARREAVHAADDALRDAPVLGP